MVIRKQHLVSVCVQPFVGAYHANISRIAWISSKNGGVGESNSDLTQLIDWTSWQEHPDGKKDADYALCSWFSMG